MKQMMNDMEMENKIEESLPFEEPKLQWQMMQFLALHACAVCLFFIFLMLNLISLMKCSEIMWSNSELTLDEGLEVNFPK